MNSDSSYAHRLFSIAGDTLELVWSEEKEAIMKASEKIVQSLSDNGVVHIFGAGHSQLFAADVSFRAGGLVPINPILDYGYTLMGGPASRSSRLERLEGYATAIIEGYDLQERDVLIIASQSGRNPGPIEAALYAKSNGLFVIAITSVEQSSTQKSRHSGDRNLYEIADLVIDNHVPVGDAVVTIKDNFPKVGPISTIVGAAILQSIVAEVAGRIIEKGETPPIWISSNVDGGDDHNLRMGRDYPSRIKPF